MIYFIDEFDRRPEVSAAQMHDIYRRLADSWQRAWPNNRLIGFFSRRYGLGPEPEYMAIWELPNWAAFDEWRSRWPEVKGIMEAIEDEYHAAVCNTRARLMERLL